MLHQLDPFVQTVQQVVSYFVGFLIDSFEVVIDVFLAYTLKFSFLMIYQSLNYLIKERCHGMEFGEMS